DALVGSGAERAPQDARHRARARLSADPVRGGPAGRGRAALRGGLRAGRSGSGGPARGHRLHFTGQASMSAARRASTAVRAASALGASVFAGAVVGAAPAPDDQLVLSGDGSTLTGDHGGGGGSATWLRKFDTGGLIGLGAEYQTIFNSHWMLGTFSGALAFG